MRFRGLYRYANNAPCCVSQHPGVFRRNFATSAVRKPVCLLPAPDVKLARQSIGSIASFEADRCVHNTDLPRRLITRQDAALAPTRTRFAPPTPRRHSRACRTRRSSIRLQPSLACGSPLPKYISSGVWPRKAECGSALLYSPTKNSTSRRTIFRESSEFKKSH